MQNGIYNVNENNFYSRHNNIKYRTYYENKLKQDNTFKKHS